MTRSMYLPALALGLPLMLTLIGAQGSLLSRLIGCAALRHVGRISYALYLFHLTVRNVVYHYMPSNSLLLNAAITVVVSLLLATASWHLLESRILARGRSRRTSEETATARRPSTAPAGRTRPSSRPATEAAG